MKINIKTITTIGAFVALFYSAQADTSWTGSVNSSWENPSNWSGSYPSTSSGITYFHNGSATAVSTQSFGDLRMSNSANQTTQITLESGADFTNSLINMSANGTENSKSYININNASWTTDTIYIANAPFAGAEAILKINYSGRLTARSISIGTNELSNGLLSSDGGRITITGGLTIGATGKVTLNSGAPLYFGNTSTASTASINGTLNFGNGGNLYQVGSTNFRIGSTGNIVIQLSSSGSIFFDTLTLGDGITPAGTLTIETGYRPISTLTEGTTIDLFDANTIVGSFAEVYAPTLTEGLTWDFSQLYTTGSVSVIADIIIPEPSTYALIFGALSLTLAIYRRRK